MRCWQWESKEEKISKMENGRLKMPPPVGPKQTSFNLVVLFIYF